jgi:hypothetical protein
MSRTRTNMSRLVASTTPDGKTRISSEEKCRHAIDKLERLVKEGYKLTNVKKKESKKVLTIMLGKEYKVTIEYFKKNLEPIGCKIIAEL